MYRSSLVLFATFAVLVGSSAGLTRLYEPKLYGRIIRGQDADISDYPYFVSVRIYDEHACGGTIIAANVVLTTAQCINDGALTEKDYSIQYGITRIGDTENLLNGTKLIVNDKHRSGTPDNDCGLIILASDIPQGKNAQFISLSTVRPAVGVASSGYRLGYNRQRYG